MRIATGPVQERAHEDGPSAVASSTGNVRWRKVGWVVDADSYAERWKRWADSARHEPEADEEHAVCQGDGVRPITSHPPHTRVPGVGGGRQNGAGIAQKSQITSIQKLRATVQRRRLDNLVS